MKLSLYVALAITLLVGCKKNDPTDSDSCSEVPGCLVGSDLASGLLSVRALADDDVWMVGSSPVPADGTGPAVLHWDGQTWTRHDTSEWEGTEVWWAQLFADQAVFVGSQGLILELDRTSGEIGRVQGPEIGITFFGVWGASPADIWAVGMHEDGPVLWRRQQGSWASFDTGLASEDLGRTFFKVHGAGANDVWVVGAGGTALHWDGTSWSRVATDTHANTETTPLLTIDAGTTPPIAVGGAGNGLILEYDGTAWVDRSPDFVPGFNGVCRGPGGSAVAVGQYGVRAVRQSDGTWSSATDLGLNPLTQEDWHSCEITPNGAIWAVGGHISSRPLERGVVSYQGTLPPAEVPL